MYRRLVKISRKRWNIPAILITLVLMLVYPLLIQQRRPKTILIHNNENLCSTKLSSSMANSGYSHTVVIVVISSRRNFLQRKLIRETYGSVKILNDVRIVAVVFMLGSQDAPDASETDITELETERAQFGDLIIGDFVDTYRNLSRKSIMAYDWLVSYCHEADIVVKTDDDVMVNIFKLTEELGLWPQKIPLNIWCAVHFNEMLNRTETSPYYVSPEEYPNDIAPKHCAGVGYITPMTVVRKIADEISRSYRGPVCQQEDIFMTGIVTEKIQFGKKEPIELIDRMVQWVMYVIENNPNFTELWKVIEQPHNETIDFVEFRRLFGTRLFFLINHGADFETVYRRMWHIVKSCYHDERGKSSDGS
ncbi:beta-1,3-galactosyltransferase 5-like isoform X2 [Bradysia coprophila]|uniref:beta-1,3-galactosyltransferase 5-like isoform X2 n=1 Tax=Bradysia coprophila TaxID=38358 RepID=UPI00187D898B|nr:beta-1,3-galactosyltransferase 5-like isoform X2 [Bradysia coprophila]